MVLKQKQKQKTQQLHSKYSKCIKNQASSILQLKFNKNYIAMIWLCYIWLYIILYMHVKKLFIIC